MKTKKTMPRLGRINYIYWNAAIWFFLPLVLTVIFHKLFNFNVANVTTFKSDIIATEVNLNLVAFWFLQIPLAIIFTVSRVKDLGWPKYLAFILWVPVINILLFLWPGNKGDNQYGIEDPKTTNYKKFLVFTLPITCMVVYSVISTL
jgi:uncharacterized membrane protein YhaH (DUF805 family)